MRKNFKHNYKNCYKERVDMNLAEAKEGEEYIIKEILTDDEELTSFLFSLGCYSGEPITVVSHLKGGCVVSIKDGRYNIDTDLAKAISI
jgi:Fe2+ transport system protein FeoA